MYPHRASRSYPSAPLNREMRRRLRKRRLLMSGSLAAGGGIAAFLGFTIPSGAQVGGNGSSTTTTAPPTTTIPPATSPAAPTPQPSQQGGQLPLVPPSAMTQTPPSPSSGSSTPSVSPNAQEQNDSGYVHWETNGTSFVNSQELVYPQTIQPSTFWATEWIWSGSGQYGGYLGLQTNSYFDGGDVAVFTAWEGTGWDAPTQNCGFFNEGGAGVQCWIPYNYNTNDTYRYDTQKVGGDGNGGYWWAGYIRDMGAGTETKVGEIDLPSNTYGQGITENFSEYFGSTFACNTSPVSWIDWSPPAFNYNGSGGYDFYSSYWYSNYLGDPCSWFVSNQGTLNGQPIVTGKLGGQHP